MSTTTAHPAGVHAPHVPPRRTGLVRAVVVAGFLVSFGAGLVVGLEARREGAAALPATRPSGPGGWLTAELDLTPQQQEQMKRIWSETARHGGREQDDRRRQIRKQRDDAIAALVRPEDRPVYEAALKTYSDQTGALEREWRAAYAGAVAQTKAILSPQQRSKYEEILRRREAERTAREKEREKGATRPAGDPRGGPEGDGAKGKQPGE